jgi:hypothetical protein
VIEGLTRAETLDVPPSRSGLQRYFLKTEVREAFLAAMGFSEAELGAEEQPFDPPSPAART